MKHQKEIKPYPTEWLDSAKELESKHKEALSKYTDLLLWWNSKVNLVSRNVSRETIESHVRHSLLVGFHPSFQRAKDIIDTGTGGGLPGLPLAICFPEKNFLLNDIVNKKMLAVKDMIKQMGLKNVSIYSGSIEEISNSEDELIVTKHAFKINDLISMLGENWKDILLLKGLDFDVELVDLKVSLDIQSFDIFETTQDDFYNGKALVHIGKANEE